MSDPNKKKKYHSFFHKRKPSKSPSSSEGGRVGWNEVEGCRRCLGGGGWMLPDESAPDWSQPGVRSQAVTLIWAGHNLDVRVPLAWP